MVKVQCRRCPKDIEIPCTEAQLACWRNGALIQNAMPDVPAGLREALISGFCEECFDEITSDPDDRS